MRHICFPLNALKDLHLKHYSCMSTGVAVSCAIVTGRLNVSTVVHRMQQLISVHLQNASSLPSLELIQVLFFSKCFRDAF